MTVQRYHSGEIVLLSFPFSNGESAKRRPALVLLDTADEDVVVSRVTSQAPRDAFDVEIVEWQAAGLLLPSTVRAHKIATIEKRLVQRRLGGLSSGDWPKLKAAIRRLWASI